MTRSLPLLSVSIRKQFPSTRPVTGQRTTAIGTWLRQSLFSGLLLLPFLVANAQTTWTSQSAHALGDVAHHTLLDVAYGAGRYVAVGEYGIIRVSTDGFVWTTKADGAQQSQGLAGIVYANGRFVVVGYNGQILTSTDGRTWSPAASGTTESLTGITFSGGKFVIVGWKGTIITSTNGLSWTTQLSNPDYILTTVAYQNGQFVVGDAFGRIVTSPNGINWTNQTVPVSGFRITAITAGTNGGFVAVGGGTTAVVLTSPDGVTWTYQPVSGTQTMLRGVAYDATQHLYVATAGPDKLVWSADGSSWTTIPPGVEAGLYGLRYINDRFIGLGESGVVRSSVNGTTWKALTLNENTTLLGAAYGNSR
ncbi:MAG: cell wall-binding protein [Spirosoma sp.]|nr:cell wall-binding protein [Spirosoma sp.]